MVNGELTHAVSEREQRGREAERLLARLLYVEETVAVKEKEKADILTAYRAVCAESARLESTIQV